MMRARRPHLSIKVIVILNEDSPHKFPFPLSLQYALYSHICKIAKDRNLNIVLINVYYLL